MDDAELTRLETDLAAWCGALDPDAVPLPDVADHYRRLARMQRLVGGAMVRLARRVEESKEWSRAGDATPQEFLAREAGTSAGKAKAALATSRQLQDLGATDDAVRCGQLSTEQTELIADAATVAPGSERELVHEAGRRSLPELREVCGRAKAASDRDAEERHRRIHARRHARHRHTPDGGGEIVYRSSVEETTEVWSIIAAHADRRFRQARKEGRHEPPEAYAADGLLAIARTAAGGSSDEPAKPVRPTEVIVRIDWDALIRGFPIGDETCEIAGIGPVPVSVVRALVEAGDTFLSAVVTKGVDVCTVAHLGRRPTAWQRTALLWHDPSCQALGCGRTWRLETDHRHDWATTKITAVALCDRLCDHCHDLKTYKGWALVDGDGKRPMVPPDDPRHPRHRHTSTGGAGPGPPPSREELQQQFAELARG